MKPVKAILDGPAPAAVVPRKPAVICMIGVAEKPVERKPLCVGDFMVPKGKSKNANHNRFQPLCDVSSLESPSGPPSESTPAAGPTRVLQPRPKPVSGGSGAQINESLEPSKCAVLIGLIAPKPLDLTLS